MTETTPLPTWPRHEPMSTRPPTVRCYHCLYLFSWDEQTIYQRDPDTGTYHKMSVAGMTDSVSRDEALRQGYVRCPNSGVHQGTSEHYLPLGYVRYLPPLVIGLVGEKEVGKTTLLATMVDEIGRGRMTQYGFTARPLVNSVHSDFQADNFNVLLRDGKAVAATPAASEGIELADAFLLTRGSSQLPVAFFDVGGESLAEDLPAIRFIQAVSALIFVVDPDRALGRTSGSRDQRGLPSSVGDRAFNTVLNRLSPADSSTAQYFGQPAVIVLAKADTLRFEPVVSRWLRQESVLAGEFDPDAVQAESRDLYAFLYQNDATPWLAPFKSFGRCTLHAVSATGGNPVERTYLRGLRPRRVLEPLLAILAMKGMLDRPGTDRVGR